MPTDFDIIVVGAGIHGCAVGQAAAAAGYSVLILERNASAGCETSSRSSKLIHGGLRYLESGQFTLVRECLQERRLLLKNAPQLVSLQPFHIPVYADTHRRPWQIRTGLSLYWLLGGKGFRQVPKAQWPQLDDIRTQGLQRIYRYYDAQTDDRRLTRSVLASAVSLGAGIEYDSTFVRAQCDSTSCEVHYRQGSSTRQSSCAVVVNAGGAWVNRVLHTVKPAPATLEIDLVQGTHLVLPGSLQRGMYYLEAPGDQRAVFVMPWGEHTLLGTTETLFTGDPATVAPRQFEIDYLLDVHAHYFNHRYRGSDIIDAFAGLRVLPRSEKSSFHRARDTRLHRDRTRCPRVLSIYGGKLTSYRITAERVIEQLAPLLPAAKPKGDTRELPLVPVSQAAAP